MIEVATMLKATQLVDSWVKGDKIPLNKWICKDGDKYIGIDNEDGECWVEEFDSPLECIKWLTEWPDEDERAEASEQSVFTVEDAAEKFREAILKAFGSHREGEHHEEDI